MKLLNQGKNFFSFSKIEFLKQKLRFCISVVVNRAAFFLYYCSLIELFIKRHVCINIARTLLDTVSFDMINLIQY